MENTPISIFLKFWNCNLLILVILFCRSHFNWVSYCITYQLYLYEKQPLVLLWSVGWYFFGLFFSWVVKLIWIGTYIPYIQVCYAVNACVMVVCSKFKHSDLMGNNLKLLVYKDHSELSSPNQRELMVHKDYSELSSPKS